MSSRTRVTKRRVRIGNSTASYGKSLKFSLSQTPKQDNVHLLQAYGKENDVIFSRADDNDMDLETESNNNNIIPFSPRKSNYNVYSNYGTRSSSGRIKSATIHSKGNLSNSIYYNPCLAYYNALDEDKQHRWYLTPDRWLLLRSHLPSKPNKLSLSNYWIINCVDTSMELLQCSCKVASCIHISYIQSNLQEIKGSFPEPVSYEYENQHHDVIDAGASTLSNDLRNSSLVPNLSKGNDQNLIEIALMEHNYPSRLHVEILREMADNLYMRRIFVVCRIYKTYNMHTGTQPVIVVQRNTLPLENSFWCRHCSVLTCIHITACIKYCNMYPLLKLTKYISRRPQRSLGGATSSNPIPIPNFLQALINISKTIESNNYVDNQSKVMGQNDTTSKLSFISTEHRLFETKENNTHHVELYSRRCKNKDCLSPDHYVIVNYEQVQSSLLYGKECVYDCFVYDIHCRCCDQITKYDGLEDNIFNYNGKILFTHSLLNFYTTAYSVTTYPFNAFVLTMNRLYTERGLHYQFVSRATFLTAWCSYVKLQQWEFKFLCPICGDHPEIIFCDGTSVSIQKIYADHLRTPIDVDSDLPLRDNTYLSSNENTCYNSDVVTIIENMIKSAKENNLSLCKSISDQYLIYVNSTIKPRHDEVELNHYYGLHRYFIHVICNNLESEKWFIEQSERRKIFITSTRLKLSLRLLSILSAKQESLVGLITPEVLKHYKIIISGVKLNDTMSDQLSMSKQKLAELRPILHDIMKTFNIFEVNDQYDDQYFKTTDSYYLLRFLDCIMLRAESIHHRYDVLQMKVGPRLNINESIKNDLEYYKTTDLVGKFYATRPVYRKLQRYKTVDKVESNSNKLHLDNTELCNKVFDAKRKYTGGIMGFWCEHGISYGFHMIQQSEALRDILSAILMHWRQSPNIIVYDNACHLMKYCHSREWEFFKNTTFLIDEFHQYNHTNCSEVHSMKAYKLSREMKYLFKNDSVAESGNSGLIKIKPSMNFLQADAAFTYTLVQLEVQNIVKTHKLLNSNIRCSNILSSATTHVSHIITQEEEQEDGDGLNSDSDQQDDVPEEDLE